MKKRLLAGLTAFCILTAMLPQGAGAAEGTPEPFDTPDTGVRITNAVIKDFEQAGGSAGDNLGSPADFDLLSGTDAIKWSYKKTYYIHVTAAFGGEVDENEKYVSITLPEGLAFTDYEGMDGKAIDSNSSVERIEGDEPLLDTGYTIVTSAGFGDSYRYRSGMLAYKVKPSYSTADVLVAVQPDNATYAESTDMLLADKIEIKAWAKKKGAEEQTEDTQTSQEVHVRGAKVKLSFPSSLADNAQLDEPVTTDYAGLLYSTVASDRTLIDTIAYQITYPTGMQINELWLGRNAKYDPYAFLTIFPEDGRSNEITSVTTTANENGTTTLSFQADKKICLQMELVINGWFVFPKEYFTNDTTQKMTLQCTAQMKNGNIMQKQTAHEFVLRAPDRDYISMIPVASNAIMNWAAGGLAPERYNTVINEVRLVNQGFNKTAPQTLHATFDSDHLMVRGFALPILSGQEYGGVTFKKKTSDGSIEEGVLTKEQMEEVPQYVYSKLLLPETLGLTQGETLIELTADLGSLLTKAYGFENGWHRADIEGIHGLTALGAYKDGEASQCTYELYPTAEGAESLNKVSVTAKQDAANASRSSVAIGVGIKATQTKNYTAGSTIPVDHTFYASYYRYGTTILLPDPVMYLVTPEGMTYKDLKLYAVKGGAETPLGYNVKPVENTTGDGASIYEITLRDDYLIGYYSGWDGWGEDNRLRVSYSLGTSSTTTGASYDLSELFYMKSGAAPTLQAYAQSNGGMGASKADKYNLNEGRAMVGFSNWPINLNITAPVALVVENGIKMSDDAEWHVYKADDPNTVASFVPGSEGQVRVSVLNNTGKESGDTVLYLPVPKKDVYFGKKFGEMPGFDMQVTGCKDSTGWKIEYGKLTPDTGNLNQLTVAPPSEPSDWSDNPTEETNMIRATHIGAFAAGAKAELIFHVKAAAGAADSGKRNLFSSWGQYTTSGGTNNPSAALLAAEVWNGTVSGSVYADANRNGVKDDGEAGAAGVAVSATDEQGKTAETVTDASGAYSFGGMRTGEITVTFKNPKSADPTNSSGSYRFSGGVTAAADNASAAAKITLNEGNSNTATVDAGLIEPFTVSFNANGQGTVNPAQIKRYQNETIGAYNTVVTVQPNEGVTFLGKWNKLTGGDAATFAGTEVENSALLAETVTEDVTYSAQMELKEVAVTAMAYKGGQDDQSVFSETVDYGKGVSSAFPTNDSITKPGYDFAGWSVNGTAVVKTRAEILSMKFTGATNFIARYTKKTGISVTLHAAGAEPAKQTITGVFGESVTYQTPVRAGYTFAGWSETEGAASGAMSITYPAEAKTYYAVWTANDVTVTFLSNGGTWTNSGKATASGAANTSLTLPTERDLFRTGYDFSGWYTDSALTSAAPSSFPAANAVWYAKWTPQTVTVTFNYGEGAVGADHSKTISKPFDSKLAAEEVPMPTRAGYSLIGWQRADKVIVPTANMTAETVNNPDGMTYQAYYIANPVTVRFDPNGGAFPDGTTAAKAYMKNQNDAMPLADVPLPQLAAKAFQGWSATKGGTVAAGNVSFDTDKTYYAVWEDAVYTVTYRLNGGVAEGAADDVENRNIKHGAGFPTPPAVTLAGNSLKGWLSMTDGKMYGADGEPFPAAVTADATYIAIWNTQTYDVTFIGYEGGGGSITVPTIYNGTPAAPLVDPPVGQAFSAWKVTSGKIGLAETYTSAELLQQKVTETVTLEAQYGEKSYEVAFIIGENGTQEGKTDLRQTVPHGGKAVAPQVTPKQYHLFLGWQTADDAETVYSSADIGRIPVYVNTGYTAVYADDYNENGTDDRTERQFDVVFTAGANGSVANAPVAYKNIVTGAPLKNYGYAAPETQADSGYAFYKWLHVGSGKFYTPEEAGALPITTGSLFQAVFQADSAVQPPVTAAVAFRIDGDGTLDGQKGEQVKYLVQGGKLGRDVPVADAPNAHVSFAGWFNAKNEKINEIADEIVTGPVAYTARFVSDYNGNDTDDREEAHYTISFRALEGGALNGAASRTVVTGATLGAYGFTVPEPAAEAGKKFAYWYDVSKDPSDSQNQLTAEQIKAMQFTADTAFAALFGADGGGSVPVTMHTVTFRAETGGTVNGKTSLTVYAPSGAALGALAPEAKADSGYRFAGWADAEKKPVADLPAEIISADTAYTARFSRTSSSSGSGSSYVITAAAGAGGTITPAGKVSVNANGGKTFAIQAADGYEIKDVLVDGKSVGAISSYTFEKVTKAHTISVSFQKTQEPADWPFTDVSDSDWFHDAVAYVTGKGWMDGTGGDTFSPNLPTTRGMIATVLYRMEQQPYMSAQQIFDDVTDGHWYTEAVAWGAANDVVRGYGDGNYGPDDPITREQLAAILHRYARYKGTAGEETDDLTRFTDADRVSAWALDDVRWAAGNGLLQGKTDNRLDPTGQATRAEVAAMLMRFAER